MKLKDLVPGWEAAGSDDLLSRFLQYVEERGFQLYPAQEAAILEIFEDKNVILNTPTGSGKSLVAEAVHFKALAQGARSVYTCPIKALVNEKWMALCREFGPEQVGLSTGDATVNRDAPILCCTAEILANIALREGDQAPVHEVVSDEFHYYGDRERGVAWQVPLLTLPQARFLLMSATLGDTRFFEEALTRLNRRPSVTVRSAERPVPLEFSYSEVLLAKTIEKLVASGKSPVYVVHFTQLDAAESAQDFTSIDVCTRQEKDALAAAVEGFRFTSPYGPVLKRWIRHGIGVHHAGLLPRYRILVEQLAQRNLLKIICGTDTLGLGINVPIRTVLFTRLCKFDGQKVGILSARDFHQIAGRAGRKGFDERGWVVAQAPEHFIENRKLEDKKAKEGKKFVKRKPPDRNFVNWDESTFKRLAGAPPEQLTSRFHVSHGMLLNVLSRKGDGCAAMRDLIRRSHEPPPAKALHRRRAWQLLRSLLEAKIVEFIPKSPFQNEPAPALRAPRGGPCGSEAAATGPGPDARSGDEAIQRRVSSRARSEAPSDRRRGCHEVAAPRAARGERVSAKTEGRDEADGLSPPQPEGQVHLPDLVGSPGLHGQGGPARPGVHSEMGSKTAEGSALRVNVALQDDFSMDQTLSLYLVQTIRLLDPAAPDYPLDLITLVESILEDPEMILRKQLDKLKAAAIAEMKLAGVEYEKRMEELEKLEYPKPKREFVYETFNEFADRHPWVGQENIQPKSIAREMFEQFRTFSDYVREYDLQRSEGLLLRHLSSVHKVLSQTVPDGAKTDEVREMEIYLRTMIQQVDSSLLDEWEKMRKPDLPPRPEAKEARPPGAEEADRDLTRDPKGFLAAIRARIFMFLRSLEVGDADGALAALSVPDDAEGRSWTAERLREAREAHRAEHQAICLDPNARNLRHTHRAPAEDEGHWIVQQVIVDPEELCDWMAEFEVDLDSSRERGEPVLRLRRIGPMG